MTDETMNIEMKNAIDLYGGNTALGRLNRERGAVGVFEVAFEYGWRSPSRKPVTGSADLDKLAKQHWSDLAHSQHVSLQHLAISSFKAGFAAAKLDNLDQPSTSDMEFGASITCTKEGKLLFHGPQDKMRKIIDWVITNHTYLAAGKQDKADQTPAETHIDARFNTLEVRIAEVCNGMITAIQDASTNQDFNARMLGSIENRLMEMQGPGRVLLENQMRALMDRYLGIMENIRDVGNVIEPISDNVAEILGLMRPKNELVETDEWPAGYDVCETGKAYNAAAQDMYNEALHKPDDKPEFKRTFSTDESGQSAGFDALHLFPKMMQVHYGVDFASPGSDHSAIVIRDRDRIGIVQHPEGAGKLVDIITFNGTVIVAYENGVYYLKGTTLQRL